MDDNLEVTERDRGKKGGGGKLSRSETVTVRLDPKLNYLCELAARAQRRTKSSFIEWAVEQSLSQTAVPGAADWNGDAQSVAELADSLWDVDEPDRLANIAFAAPTLMTHEEQVLWKVLCGYTYLWRGRWTSSNASQEEWTYEIKADSLIRDHLREQFEKLKAV